MAVETIFPKRNMLENPLASTDDHHGVLASDPTIAAFPADSSFGSDFGSGFGTTPPVSTTAAPVLMAAPTTTITQGASSMSNNPQINAQQDQSKLIQSSGGAMQEGADSLVKADDSFGTFINSKWRPMMALIYMVTCACDFTVFPIMWSLLQALSGGQVTSQWMPLTLQGAGLYHIAMGAILGIAAYGRSQEKIAGKA
jgi:hypothetical protein